ncbi:MAG: hypothetical protein ACR2GW_15245, partial [Pyrinomonadaceae bacterium]
TDSQMGEDYIEQEFGVPAGNARRDGARLFSLISQKVSSFGCRVSGSILAAQNSVASAEL